MYTYIIESQGYYKIGKARDIVNRIESYRSHNPVFEIIRCYEGDFEKELQTVFLDKIVFREWFKLTAEDIVKADGHANKEIDVELREFYMKRFPEDNNSISTRIKGLINKKSCTGFSQAIG
jgi:hypothetical protein